MGLKDSMILPNGIDGNNSLITNCGSKSGLISTLYKQE